MKSPEENQGSGALCLRGDDHQPLALTEALASAARYRSKSRSDATWLAYEQDWRRFVAWCDDVAQSALPATAETVCAFISREADLGLAAATITRRLAAIRLVHLAAELPSPHNGNKVRDVMRGIRRDQRDREQPKKAPLLDTDVATLVDTLDQSTLAGRRDRALLLLGFAGALRRSELVAIEVSHLSFQPEGLTLLIPYSKTDQAGKGHAVAVPTIPYSRYCPVTALQQWLSKSGLSEGPVFRRLVRGPRLGQTRLSAGSVAKIIKQHAKAAGFSDTDPFAGHSLRRGFITTAARNRADVFAIAAQSRHRSLDTVREYVDAEARFDDHPGLAMFR